MPPDRAGAGAWPGAVIFDLDGTLVDSAADVAAALNAILAQEGHDPFSPAQVRSMMGHGIRALIDKALRALGTAAADERLDRLRDRFLEVYGRSPAAATTVYPHAADLLAHLAGRRIAVGVCTNKDEGPARRVLDEVGLGRHLGTVVGADSGFGQKPDPGPLLACAAKLGVPREGVVYVGDHAVDVATARAAGIPIVAVAFGYSAVPAGDLGADRLVGCLSELPAALAGLA
jgi:phosphoglycolate phosphatase